MSLESGGETSVRDSREVAAPKVAATTENPSSAPSLGRRALIKAVGGGIMGAIAATEALAPRSLAAEVRGAAEPSHTPPAPPPSNVAGVFDVKAFGAVGDGTTIDSDAINKAIDAAVAAGGGTVRFPAGTYATFSIRLKSNVQLYIGPGATILGAATPASGVGYDPAEPKTAWDAYQDFGHNHWHNSLIWGENLENVSIVGPGLIHGLGLTRGQNDSKPGVGDKAIALKLCHNVTLRDFSILQGGHFGILATGVDNLTIDSLRIDTNRDGMDIDCCRDVHISNCTVNSPWDDAIVLKSSYALGEARSTDHVTITNCFVTGGYALGSVLDCTWKPFDGPHHDPLTGRIKCGTESNGGFRNIAISNCVFDKAQGLALETVDGAILEDISITNITMRGITSSPLFLRLGRRMRGPATLPVGVLRRVNISNIVVSDSASKVCCMIMGIPNHVIEDVRISNVFVQHQGGGTADDAAFIPAEDETRYPDPWFFPRMPTNGFFIRHAKNVELRDIEIQAVTPDARPTFGVTAVEGAEFFNVCGPKDVPLFSLHDVQDFTAVQCKQVDDTELDDVDHKTF